MTPLKWEICKACEGVGKNPHNGEACANCKGKGGWWDVNQSFDNFVSERDNDGSGFKR